MSRRKSRRQYCVPDMFIPPADERHQHDRALAAAVEVVGANVISPGGQAELRRIVFDTHNGAFRRALIGDPPPDVKRLGATQ